MAKPPESVPAITQPLPNTAATYQLGYQLGQTLSAGTVLLLKGDLGSGKTTLVQGLGAGLGIADTIDSPTFTLINEYLTGRIPLYHMDLYRLSVAETDGLNLDLYWDEQEVEPGIVAIEWAERLQTLPEAPITISLEYAAAGRLATLTATNPDIQALLERLHEILANEV